MRKHVLVSLLLSAAVLAGAGGLGFWFIAHRPPAEQRPREQVVPKVTAPPVVVQRDYRVEIVAYGSVRPRVKVGITPEVSGKVTTKAANYLAGRYVSRGQVLLQIETTDYEQARDSAQRSIELLDARLGLLDQEEANLEELEKIERGREEVARKQYERAQKLLERGASTENEVDVAREALLSRRQQLQTILNQKATVVPQREQLKAERRVAEVARAKAQTALGRTVVASPVGGRVLSCEVEAGDWVQAGKLCGPLYGMEIMEIPVSVPASDLQWIDRSLLAGHHGVGEAGRHIRAEVCWEEPGTGRTFTWNGYVSRIEAGLAALTRTATLVVEVENPNLPASQPASGAAPAGQAVGAGATAGRDQPMLDINMFCKVTIFGRTEPGVILLPRQAIQPDGTVFLADSEGRLGRRAVTVARFTDEQAMILPGPEAGVAEGDRVITSYVAKPVLGMAVDPSGSETPASPQAGGPDPADRRPGGGR